MIFVQFLHAIDFGNAFWFDGDFDAGDTTTTGCLSFSLA
jgi:hypothetical protein